MTVVPVATGAGGWPLNVFLTPGAEAVLRRHLLPAATTAHGRPGFLHGAPADREALWQERARRTVDIGADEITAALDAAAGHRGRGQRRAALSAEPRRRALAHCTRLTIAAHGGFGGAPKFPPHPASPTPAALREAVRRRRTPLGWCCTRCDAMAAGGIHDHLGGGFHRYSVDAEWLVPHFEKMLYDNALLRCRPTSRRCQAHGESATTRRVARDIARYVLRDMTRRGRGASTPPRTPTARAGG